MKVGISLLLVCIVTVAGVAIWLFGIDPVRPYRSADVTPRQEREPPPEGSSHVIISKPASKSATSRIPQTRAVIEPASVPEVSAAAPNIPDDQIPAGTLKETIVKTYGDPALSTRRLDRGHDLETLVYTRDRGKEVAVISLEDGKVSSAYSHSGITSAVVTARPRQYEHTPALFAGSAPQTALDAILPTAEAPKPIPKVFDETPAELPTAAKLSAKPSVQANVGTCGEYRDGKLTVKPCSQGALSPSEWLAQGSGATATKSVPAGNPR